jgi:hypothetical protein
VHRVRSNFSVVLLLVNHNTSTLSLSCWPPKIINSFGDVQEKSPLDVGELLGHLPSANA